MPILPSLNTLYTPIQPDVQIAGIHYQELKPAPALREAVYCYWQLKTEGLLKESFYYRVVSDGCIDIFFEHRRPEMSFIMGFCRKYTEFPLGKSFDYIGIRFLPGVFPHLFNISALRLSNISQPLKDILPDFSAWLTAHVTPEMALAQLVTTLDIMLEEIVSGRNDPPDERFTSALQLLLKQKGYLDTETALNTGLSSRQLRRIFNYYIGTTPKTFANVVRFQHILRARPSRQSLRADKLYLDAGFFDQAHFIRDFRKFYGVTPMEAFR